MKTFVIVGLFVVSALAVPTPEIKSDHLNCAGLEDSFFSCLAIKANSVIARVARSNNIDILDGVTFIRDTPVERSGKSLKSETELMNELPVDSSERALKLGSMLYDSVVSFFKSHSLKINLPDESVSRAISEGRTKFKHHKMMPMLLAAAIKIFALAPILFGGLSLLVMKAVFVGKLALMIAGILAFQKLFGANSVPSVSSIFGKNAAPAPAAYYDAGAAQSWAAPTVQQPQQGYYKRSFEEASKNAQNLAYSAHVPTENDH